MFPPPISGARSVRFDDAVAADCIRCLDELIDRIDATAYTTQAGVGDCTAEWRGGSRAWFDASHDAAIDRVRRARASARTLIDAIRANQGAAIARQTDLNGEALRARAAEVARFEQLAAAATAAAAN